jgi:nicotinamide-nucleotide amidase
MKISLLLTGNELMSGDTVDSNSAYIAQSLKDLNLVPYVKKVVGDDLKLLISSIRELAQISDVLVINGGLGPTNDDLTSQALAEAVGSTISRNEYAYNELKKWAEPRGFILTESNLKQADLPDVCDVIDNPVGSAVGFRCMYKECLIMCTPGVPSEFKVMVENQILPLIKVHGTIQNGTMAQGAMQRGTMQLSNIITRLRLFGITESGLQDTINRVFPEWPKDVDLGFRVQMPVIEIKIATVGDDSVDLNQYWVAKFTKHFSDYIIGRDSTRLTQALNKALLDYGHVITVAESCTGGAISAGITSESGSSRVFEAGYVTYSDKVKTSTLNVKQQTLNSYGAVSAQVVEEMVEGALIASSASIGLAVSGIAGPDGGTDDKPVGTVWIAWGEKGWVKSRCFYLPMSRTSFQKFATAIAMDLVRREVLGLPTNVDYFSELKRKAQ